MSPDPVGSAPHSLLEDLLERGELTLIDPEGLARAEGKQEDLVAVAVDLMREQPGMLQLKYEADLEPLGKLSVVLKDRARAIKMLQAEQIGARELRSE